jgi:hypothetical protein
MSQYKPGARLRSAVCATEVVVIAAPAADIVIRCGGAPLLGEGETAAADAVLDAAAAQGSLMGKRYTNESGALELLCVKPGAGSLVADSIAMVIKGAKPLPSSD